MSRSKVLSDDRQRAIIALAVELHARDEVRADEARTRHAMREALESLGVPAARIDEAEALLVTREAARRQRLGGARRVAAVVGAVGILAGVGAIGWRVMRIRERAIITLSAPIMQAVIASTSTSEPDRSEAIDAIEVRGNMRVSIELRL